MSGSGQYVDAEHQRVAIELPQRQISARHLELRVEVLVAREQADVAVRGAGNHAIPGFAVKSAQRARHVRIHANRAAHRVVQQVGVADRHLRELAAQLEAVARVAYVGLAERDGHVEPRTELESRSPGPEARARRSGPRTPTYSRRPVVAGPPDVRVRSFLPPAAQAFLGAELARVQRRHDVGAIAPPPAELAVHAGAYFEPGRRDDDGIDERALDAVVDGRLVALVDDARRAPASCRRAR